MYFALDFFTNTLSKKIIAYSGGFYSCTFSFFEITGSYKRLHLNDQIYPVNTDINASPAVKKSHMASVTLTLFFHHLQSTTIMPQDEVTCMTTWSLTIIDNHNLLYLVWWRSKTWLFIVNGNNSNYCLIGALFPQKLLFYRRISCDCGKPNYVHSVSTLIKGNSRKSCIWGSVCS